VGILLEEFGKKKEKRPYYLLEQWVETWQIFRDFFIDFWGF